MTVELRIPKLGQAMTEGTLAEWLVADGTSVNEGDPLYRIETDKVEVDIEAPVAGRLVIVADAGATYQIGDEVGRIETSG